jgi:hypothetical protein
MTDAELVTWARAMLPTAAARARSTTELVAGLADSVERLTRELAEARDALDAFARLVHKDLASQAKALWKAGSIEHSDVLSNALDGIMSRINTFLLIAKGSP